MRDEVLRYLRWLAVLPAVYLAWHLALLMGMGMLAAVEAFCPPEETVSGLCVAEWFALAESAVVIVSAAVAAALIVLAAAVTAPSHRRAVAATVFLGGAALAGYLLMQTGEFGAFGAAVLSGALALAAIWKLDRNRQA